MGTLCRRPQFADEPAARVRGHGVTGYHRGFNATAFLALECTAVEPGGSGLELRQQHAIPVARRAAGPLDGRHVRGRYRLTLGHQTSWVVLLRQWRRLRMTFPASTQWSKLLTLKNLNHEVNESNGDPGKCNSNAGYLSLRDRQRCYGRMRTRH